MDKKNLYNQRYIKLNRKAQRITVIYLLLLGTAFFFISYILMIHIDMHINFKDALNSKFSYIIDNPDPGKSNITHLSNINKIKESVYELYSKGSFSGLGIALTDHLLISPVNADNISININGEYRDLYLLDDSGSIILYSTRAGLNPLEPDYLEDISNVEITDNIALFTKINDRYTFSKGIISNKHSIMEGRLYMEADIRLYNLPRGSLLFSKEGGIIGLSVLSIDGGFNFFASINELYNLDRKDIKAFLENSSLKKESYEEYYRNIPDQIERTIIENPYHNIFLDHILLQKEYSTVLLLAFFKEDKLYDKNFDADIIIEIFKDNKSTKYTKSFIWSFDNINTYYIKDRNMKAIELNIDIPEPGLATFYIEFSNYKTKSQRIIIP